MKLDAYAKLNLSLDILGKRKDNFHNLNSIMQQIGLHDELTFEDSDKVTLKSGIKFKDDIVLKTIRKIKRLFEIDKGVKVTLKKNIPVGVGLGSGSTDAATTLIALNELWGLDLSLKDMLNIGAEIGSDVPFCLVGGRCFVSGKGEKIDKVASSQIDVLLVDPGYQILTKDAYRRLDKIRFKKTPSSLKLKNKKSLKDIAANIHDDFIHIQKDDVKQIIKELVSKGALNASITGKGPAVFGLFEDKKKASKAFYELKDNYSFVYQTKTIV